jgi:hypothetical protein
MKSIGNLIITPEGIVNGIKERGEEEKKMKIGEERKIPKIQKRRGKD